MENAKKEGEKETAPWPWPMPKIGRLLTRKEWFAIAVAIIAPVLTVIGIIGVREHYQADVRYEQGSWYRSGGMAIASLRIKNYGAADAEALRLTASFDHTVQNVSLDDPGIVCQFDCKTDPKTVIGTIDRLVPKQTVVVYFAISLPSPNAAIRDEFVKSLTYKGGQGTKGEPTPQFSWLGACAAILVLSLIQATASWTAVRYFDKRQKKENI